MGNDTTTNPNEVFKGSERRRMKKRVIISFQSTNNVSLVVAFDRFFEKKMEKKPF
jgi:hypothetical protein